MQDILLIEDNEELAELLQAFLIREGYTVFHAASGEAAAVFLEKDKTKLILLDIMLPGMDGFAFCRQVRERNNMPILIMSARSGRENQLTGYELGADDYIEKPVDVDILTAKIKALLQRSYGVLRESAFLVSGGITLDTGARKAFLMGEPLELNAKEYDLLLLLAENTGKTLRKEYIFSRIWGMDSFSEIQTLTVHIKMLRTKIEADPREPERILTVWGVGYRYEEV